MGVKFQYKPPDAGRGDLRTRVAFYERNDSGFELNDNKYTKLFECFAEAYSPSVKDLEVMSVTGTKEGITIRIRDTRGEYIPSNKHFCMIEDYRYTGKILNVVDIRYDMKRNGFITILLGYSS